MKKPFFKLRKFFDLEKPFFSYVNIQKIPRKLFNYCPSSAPFLSGDTFRSLSDVQYDPTRKCRAKDIFENAIVYVSSWLIDEFCEKILPAVSSSFILITHHEDKNFTDSYISLADNPHIKHWFTQNCLFEHPKVTPLPLGLENAYKRNAGYVPDFKQLAKVSVEKKPKIVLAFSIYTNKEKRQPCYEALKPGLITEEFKPGLNCREYRKELIQYMFVASPPGSGLDCHRTWEAIYLGVIPLVEDNFMHRYFVSLGLPMILIDDWRTPAKWTKEQAQDLYYSTLNNAKTDAAYFDYWKQKILHCKTVK